LANPLVSIVVVNWNGKRYLSKCFNSLKEVTYKNLEVVMVDGGSTDGSVELVRKNYPWIRVIQHEANCSANMGLIFDRNLGVRKTTGKYIIFLDNDTHVEADFINELVPLMEADDKIGACQSKILLEDRKTLDSQGDYQTKVGFLYARGTLQTDNNRFNSIEEIFSGKGAALTVRRKAFEEIGMLDENFFIEFEDGDLCWRLWIAGYKVLYIPKSIVYHVLGGTIGTGKRKYLTRHYCAFRNRISSMIKNFEAKYLLQVGLLHIVLCWGIIVYLAIRRRPYYALAISRAIWANVINFRRTWKKRQSVQITRKVSDENLMSHLMVRVNFMELYRKMQRILLSE